MTVQETPLLLCATVGRRAAMFAQFMYSCPQPHTQRRGVDHVAVGGNVIRPLCISATCSRTLPRIEQGSMDFSFSESRLCCMLTRRAGPGGGLGECWGVVGGGGVNNEPWSIHGYPRVLQ